MQAYWLAVGILVVWRIAHLLQAEDGPWRLIVRLRRRAGSGVLGELLDCFYCLSLWVAIPVAWGLGDSWLHSLLLWPALSGGAALAERATARREDNPVPAYYEESPIGEPEDVLLRKR